MYEEQFKDNVKDLSSKTFSSYLSYIRRLDKAFEESPARDNTELIQKMNDFIVECNKGEEDNKGEKGGLMARSAFIKLLKVLGETNPDFKLISAKSKEREILLKWLKFPVIKQIVDGCEDKELKLIMMLQYETCSRIGDILNLKVGNVDEDRIVRFVTQKVGNIKTNAITKGTYDLFKEYVDGKGKRSKVFSLDYHAVWSKQQKLLKSLKELLGNDIVNVSSHWLRASRAVHLYQAGVDLETIQREGGWESVESLLKYLKMAGMDSKQTLEKVKPEW